MLLFRNLSQSSIINANCMLTTSLRCRERLYFRNLYFWIDKVARVARETQTERGRERENGNDIRGRRSLSQALGSFRRQGWTGGFRVSIFYLDEIRRKLKSRKTRVALAESLLTKRGHVARSRIQLDEGCVLVKCTSYFPSLPPDNRNQLSDSVRPILEATNATFARLFAHYGLGNDRLPNLDQKLDPVRSLKIFAIVAFSIVLRLSYIFSIIKLERTEKLR